MANMRSRNTTKTSKPKPSVVSDPAANLAGHISTAGKHAEEEPAHCATKKRSISEAITDIEDTMPTKKIKSPHRGRNAGHQQQKLSASPITLPRGPRKRTNEHPGLIGKTRRRTKEEVAAEKAEKEAKVKAVAAAKADAVAHLAKMEVDQEHAVAMQHQCISWRQPSVLDVTKENSSEGSGENPLENGEDTDISDTDSEDEGNTTPNVKLEGPVAVPNQEKPKVSKKGELFETIKHTPTGTQALEEGAACPSREGERCSAVEEGQCEKTVNVACMSQFPVIVTYLFQVANVTASHKQA